MTIILFIYLIELDAVTYEKFMQFARNTNKSQGTGLKNEEMGIMVLTSFDYYDDDSAPEVRDPWFKDTVYNVSSCCTYLILWH